jgi:hypothetical protein
MSLQTVCFSPLTWFDTRFRMAAALRSQTPSQGWVLERCLVQALTMDLMQVASYLEDITTEQSVISHLVDRIAERYKKKTWFTRHEPLAVTAPEAAMPQQSVKSDGTERNRDEDSQDVTAAALRWLSVPDDTPEAILQTVLERLPTPQVCPSKGVRMHAHRDGTAQTV